MGEVCPDCGNEPTEHIDTHSVSPSVLREQRTCMECGAEYEVIFEKDEVNVTYRP